MKKTARQILCILLCICLGGALSGCGQSVASGSQEQTVPGPTAEPIPMVEPAVPSHSDMAKAPVPASPAPWAQAPSAEEAMQARTAYAAALEQLMQKNILPDGSDYRAGGIPDDIEMALNRFAVCDVDGDGREELVLLYTTTIVAGQRGLVLDWDATTQRLRTQMTETPGLTFYASGAVRADWSHNQGKGGSFWPYTLYRYEPYLDSYISVGHVDAWDETLGIEGYPDEIDTSDAGFVYYIATSGTYFWDGPMDERQYLAWLHPYLRDTAQLEIELLALTEENVQSILKK